MINESFHLFYDKEAVTYGVNGAIFLNYIKGWLKINRDKNNNYKEGKFWTYDTMKTLAQKFPFWTERQIRHTVKKLIEQGAIEVGNHNKKGFDRTLWYTLSDELYPDEFRTPLASSGPEKDEKPNKNGQVTKVSNAIDKSVKSKLQNCQIIRQKCQTNTNRLTTLDYSYNILGGKGGESEKETSPKIKLEGVLKAWGEQGLPMPEFKSVGSEMAWQSRIVGKLMKLETSPEALNQAIENYGRVITDQTLDYSYEVSLEQFVSRKYNGDLFCERFMEGFFNLKAFKKKKTNTKGMEDYLNSIPEEKRYNFNFGTQNSDNTNVVNAEFRRNG